jgi:hypothetical protein
LTSKLQKRTFPIRVLYILLFSLFLASMNFSYYNFKTHHLKRTLEIPDYVTFTDNLPHVIISFCYNYSSFPFFGCDRRSLYSSGLAQFLFVVKGPAADATDAPQPSGLLCSSVLKMISFFVFTSNGEPVEWNWQGKTEVLGGKTCPSATLSTTNPTWTDPGSKPGLRGERPATNRLSHGTDLQLS